MRKPEKSAGEKTNQHKVSAPIPDKAKYPPGTIGSNKDLARQEALVEIQRLGPNLPQALQFGFYVCNSFCYASFLAYEGRQPLLNTRAGFIGDYVRLVVNFDSAEKIRVLNNGTLFLEKWPQNPEKFGPDAGWSALDVAYKFSQRIRNAILCARTTTLGVEVHNQFDSLSINDTPIDKWIEVFHKGCHGEFLPPQAQWPTWQIKTDADFLIRKLDNEYDSAKQAIAKAQAVLIEKFAQVAQLAIPMLSDRHSDDFTYVRWNGEKYCFNKTQARCVKLLWDNETLSEKTIGENIQSAADNFRLLYVFRNRTGKGMHPAWGTMIVKHGKGIYGLNRAAQKSQKNHT